MEKKNTWEAYSSKQLKELEKINAQYRDFLDNGKTERECIETIVNQKYTKKTAIRFDTALIASKRIA